MLRDFLFLSCIMKTNTERGHMKNHEFYKQQYKWLEDLIDPASYLIHSKRRIESLLEEISFQPKWALELGSGNGYEAIAMSKMHIQVDAIEVVEEAIQSAKSLAEKFQAQVNFLQEDFFKFEPDKSYDLVYYLDGFGVGSDQDQEDLLKKINQWLSENGRAYIEVYNPKYWLKVKGVQMTLSDHLIRTYDYDLSNHRMVDTWEEAGKKERQSLRCYRLEEMKTMCQKSDLEIIQVFPGGAMDYDRGTYQEIASLDTCMLYKLILRKRKSSGD